MEHHVEDITAFDNANGAGILAKVVFNQEDHNQSVRVNVRLKLDRSLSLAEVEKLAVDEARSQLKSLASSF